jgi:ankyrin repeat protein
MLSYKIANQHGYTATYQLLLDNGSEVNVKDKDGYTSLHYGEFLLNN